MNATTLARAASLPQTDRGAARRGLEEEYAVLLATVSGLTPEDWRRPTDCTEWTVRDLVAHLAGSAEAGARVSTNLRQFAATVRGAARRDRDPADYMCMFQIAQRARLSDDQVRGDLEHWAPEAPAAIERAPRILRRIRLPRAFGFRPGVRLDYQLDVISSRDVWMHRVDLHRATGHAMPETSHEAEVVAQVVRDLDHEWSGPALDLTLTGRGGGRWRIGEGPAGASVTEDAVAYLRLLSGRSDECGLATDVDPQATRALREARVVF